jgi:hypothetical protein
VRPRRQPASEALAVAGGEGFQHLQQGTRALGDEGLDGGLVRGRQAGRGAASVGRVLAPLDQPGPTQSPTSSLAVDSDTPILRASSVTLID